MQEGQEEVVGTDRPTRRQGLGLSQGPDGGRGLAALLSAWFVAARVAGKGLNDLAPHPG